ncbi:MAG: NAD(P)-dependent oxidoreductase, partial [Promethearchaeota archaeon]
MEQKIGWIGTGVMGKSMCAHLMKAGYKISVYNRSKEKANGLIDMGAIWCSNPREVAEKSDILFTIVGFPHDVEEVYFGENGILKSIKSGSIIIDMTTSEPSLAQKIYNEARKMGVSSLDAPVSGGDVGAKNGTLAIMIGGDKEAYETILPFFNLMGQNISYMGKEGAGQHTKMSNQILIASTMIG